MLKAIYDAIKSRLRSDVFLNGAINGYYYECAPIDAAIPYALISLTNPQVYANRSGNNWRTELAVALNGPACGLRDLLEAVSSVLDRKIILIDDKKCIFQLKEISVGEVFEEEIDTRCITQNTAVFDVSLISSKNPRSTRKSQ